MINCGDNCIFSPLSPDVKVEYGCVIPEPPTCEVHLCYILLPFPVFIFLWCLGQKKHTHTNTHIKLMWLPMIIQPEPPLDYLMKYSSNKHYFSCFVIYLNPTYI